MDILEVNNNVLRESRYSLKIVNGEAADVYLGGPTYFWPNKTLTDFGYWKDFLSTTDSITIPLLGISQMTKYQSIWFRNKEVVDSCNITVSNDYNNNIIEFLNKGIKNADLDFDSIEQLIFIVEVEYINSVGFVSKKSIFVGRPEINKDSASVLSFKVRSMDHILNDTTFETDVVEYPTASFFNFINLKEAFENTYNSPHKMNDDYAYPCVPFELNSDTYLPDDPYIYNEYPHLQASDYAYAEDTILGNEDYVQTFFYRGTPECGIVTFPKENPENTTHTYLSEWRMFTNQDDLPSMNLRAVRKSHENAFRMFRPIRSFISDRQVTNMSVAQANYDPGYYLLTRYASDAEFRIDSGDEIVIVEQCMDLGMINDDGSIIPSVVVLFNESVNVYYYNKTKDIFYWNPIIQGASSIPFHKQWYDMLSYIDVDSCNKIRYDINYKVYQDYSGEIDKLNKYKYITYTNNMFSEWMYQTNHHIRRDNNMNTSTSGGSRGAPLIANMLPADLLAGWKEDEDGTDADPRYVENDQAGMELVLDKIYSMCNPKSVVLDEDLNIMWGYGTSFSSYSYANNVNGQTTTNIKNVFNINNTVNYAEDKRFSGHTGQPNHYLYELSTNFGDNQIALGFNTFWFNGVPYSYLDEVVCNIMGKEYNKFDPFLDNFYRPDYPVGNINVDGDTVYMALNTSDLTSAYRAIQYVDLDGEYSEDGINWYAYKEYLTRNVLLLDVNVALNSVILVDQDDGNKLKYETIDTEVNQENVIVSNAEYLLSMQRDRIAFTDTHGQENYVYVTGNLKTPIRLLGFEGTRLAAGVGVANSFFKNMYNDNTGVKRIGFEQPSVITLNDDMIEDIDVKTYNFNKLEWSNFNRTHNTFGGINNDLSDSKETDDDDYDEALTVNMYSSTDVDMSITLTRTSAGIDWQVSNTFTTANGPVTGSITPVSYSAFQIPLTGIFDGITITCNFLDTEIELGRTFGGQIERSELDEASTKSELVSTNKKYTWKNDKTMGLKFPFLYSAYDTYFSEEMDTYFTDADYNIRKLLVVEVTLEELILFNDNYGIFNMGEQRVLIDSKTKYLNGYGFYRGSLIPFNDNRATFYIEKVVYDFTNNKTKLTLISI